MGFGVRGDSGGVKWCNAKGHCTLQDEAAEVASGGKRGDAGVDVGGVDGGGLAAAVGRGKTDFFEEFFQHCVQAAGADVFDAVVDVGGEVGEGVDGVFGEGEGEAFGADEGLVLFDQGGFGFGEDAAEVVAGEGGEFDADG